MGCIDYYGAALDDSFFQRYAHGLVDQHVEQIHVLQTHAPELAERARIYHVIFRHHSEKVLVGEIIS